LLLELRVRDVGIIDEMGWRPGTGLNVITGETGAGKSLVIDAVEALLGAKPDEETVRHGAGAARIEGVFSIPPGPGAAVLRNLLSEKGVPADDSLVIACELRRQGRSIIRLNGQAVPRTVLQQIGRLLVDVHGQSDHLSLLDRRRHLDFLDSYAGTQELGSSFAGKAAALHRARQALGELSENERETARLEEFLRFQLDEIGRARLREGEDADLERERNLLAAAEKLKELSYQAYQRLHGDDNAGTPVSAADGVREAVQAMKQLAELDPAMKGQLESLEACLYGLEEAARDIRAYGERLEHDPQRLQEVETRLELLRDLKRKYGQTIADILAYQEKAAADLAGIFHASERRAELEESCLSLKQEMGRIAAGLSGLRREASRRLEAEVARELEDLDMGGVQFEVRMMRHPAAAGIPFPDGETCAFDATGADDVEFFVSTNPGEPLRPLARIASTGEMSRFMLALKGALSAADSTPVLVFDEIDIGVGGRSGEVIGRKLSALSRDHQVVCVTHLPQIAAFADSHHRVHKEVSGERTLSRLQTLEGEARLAELATMLAGAGYTDTALESARELRQRAEEWKRSTVSSSPPR